MRRHFPEIVLLSSSILWGLLWLPNKYVHAAGVDALWLTAIAHAGVAFLALPWLVRQLPHWRSTAPTLITIALIGGAANVAFNMALIYGDVVRAMTLFYLLPVWGILGGRIFLSEKITSWRFFCVLIVLSGTYLLLSGASNALQQFSLSDFLALASGFLLAMNNLVFRATSNQALPAKIAALFFGSAVVAFSTLVLRNEINAPPSLQGVALSLGVGVGFLLLASFGTLWAVTKMEAARSTIIMVTELVTSVVSAALLRQSELSDQKILGIILIILAIIFIAIEKSIFERKRLLAWTR